MAFGRAWPAAKAYSLGFLLEDRHEGKQLSWRLAFAQIKPAKINLSLFGRWFQLNGGRAACSHGDVLKRLVKQERPQRLSRSVPNCRQKRNVPNCRIRSKTTPQVEDGQRAGRI